MLKTRVGRIFRCVRCEFEMDSQKLALVNVYLRYARMRRVTSHR